MDPQDTPSDQLDVWLVKVPKYISNTWKSAPEKTELGRLKQNEDGSFDLDLNSNRNRSKTETDSIKQPSGNYKLTLNPITHQKMVIISQIKDPAAPTAPSSGTNNNSSSVSDKISFKGEVSLRGELRTSDNAYYMSLKSNSIREAAKPSKVTQILDKAVTTYKPRGATQLAHEAELRKKKDESKRTLREDKEIVLNRLYAAFEKQQYYNIKDLVRLTNQPAPYLKEILKEICIYCSKSAHKNMWELKPEYRHYKS